MKRLVWIPACLLSLAACTASVLPRTTIHEVTPNETTQTFHLQNRDEQFALTLPKEWTAKFVAEGDDMMVLLVPRSAFGFAVYVPTTTDGKSPPDDPSWQKGALESIRDSLEANATAGYTWMGSENVELFERPALQTTVKQEDNTIVRDTYFFRGDYLYTASFVTVDDGLETAWPAVEKALETMTFSLE